MREYEHDFYDFDNSQHDETDIVQIPTTATDEDILKLARQAMMDHTGLEEDEIDLEDGTVHRLNHGHIAIQWEGSRGSQPISTLKSVS